ncbi:cytochrome P450 superfamily [Renibacterium salmoninarum ATCC 33209]|uniref:Cytochrome P450 superfamily n=1 Tax=Renibacterium salmoninarum (strain ATCC 33209 / DSM 20767 / JCM 11484 / NBRC 15589 / NCIMB 2235) TaxID=288705 RepID=A9WSL0_RENSM|nr:cytochrome P450 [Renibacterium salmoninarum]ABY23798.1 cytochrome P450 superfamily [Renibacterium salmoninarum ATCC 33209]
MSCPFTDHQSTLNPSPEPFTRDGSGAVELFGPNYLQDPYQVFKRLNEVGAIHRVRFPSGVHAWLVTGAAAAEDLLHHPDIRKNHEFGNAKWRAKASIMPEPQHTRLQSHLLHQDAAVHAGMRRLIVPAFSAKAANAMTSRIQAIADQLIDSLPARGSVDLITDFMAAFPFRVLADAIGLPPILAEKFDHSWGKVVRPVGPDDPWRPEYERLLRELENYIALIIEECGKPAQTGLLSELVLANKKAAGLSDAQLSSLIFQVLVAGQEPVTHQLSTSLLALLANPEAMAAFCAEPDRREDFIDALIKYDGAFALATWRFFAVDTKFYGQLVPAGDSVIVALNAANRDEIYGDQLDLSGNARNHFGFGGGPHYCPGSMLARRELAIGLGTLIDRLAGLELDHAALDDGGLSWVAAVLNRGLVSLPVRYQEVLA